MLEARTSRRGLLVRSAVAGSALAVAPWRYVLRPGTAYAAICGCAGSSCDCGSACCDGYTEFCCVVNQGANSCPPGTFEGGWWRADGSAYCNGPRYYVDCNSQCGSPPPCGCAGGNCNNRRAGCNQFRYGQCHTEIACAGPIVCRVVSCTPPYQLYPGTCGQTLLFDNATANHTANCPSPPPPPPAPPGWVITSLHSGKVLDVTGVSKENGAPIQQWEYNGGGNQRWIPEHVGGGTYRMVAAHSGKVLDVSAFSKASGAPIIQWDWHGGANQRWILRSPAPGVVKFVNVNSAKVLDVTGVSTANGARIQQWSPTTGANQRWVGTFVA